MWKTVLSRRVGQAVLIGHKVLMYMAIMPPAVGGVKQYRDPSRLSVSLSHGARALGAQLL